MSILLVNASFKFMIEITTGVVFLLSSMYGSGSNSIALASAPNINNSPDPKVVNQIAYDKKTVEKYVREQYKDTPILIEIARCESMFSQFDKNGNIVRGIVNPFDVGVMQINEKYHLGTARSLGYDLHTIEGNTAYAKYLYEKEGSAPWKASSACWNAKNA